MSIPPHEPSHNRQRPPAESSILLDELRALRAEICSLRRVFDDFARVYLNARFPYGKPTDRWGRRG